MFLTPKRNKESLGFCLRISFFFFPYRLVLIKKCLFYYFKFNFYKPLEFLKVFVILLYLSTFLHNHSQLIVKVVQSFSFDTQHYSKIVLYHFFFLQSSILLLFFFFLYILNSNYSFLYSVFLLSIFFFFVLFLFFIK